MIIFRLELEEFSISLFIPKGLHLANRTCTCITFLVLKDKISPRFEEIEWVPRLADPNYLKQNFFFILQDIRMYELFLT